jgi:magnesium transporter
MPTHPGPTPTQRRLRESSAAHVDPQALVVGPDETADALRERLRAGRRTGWELVCVVDAAGCLIGTLTAAELLALPGATPLGAAARRQPPTVPPGADQERMASEALHHGVTAMPVVDADGRLVGVVGSARLMAILRREHVEDLHRLAGIAREADPARRALEDPPLRRARHRLPWLLVGLFGSMVATFIVARFEQALAARPVLAFFVPGLVYLADAIGTQTEAVAVRGLSLSHAPLPRLLGGELRTGALIGGVLALIAWPMVWLAFGDADLALAVTLALVAASLLASLLGLLLPWALARLGTDPAYGSGPLATIVQDVLSLLIYFGSVSLILF